MASYDDKQHIFSESDTDFSSNQSKPRISVVTAAIFIIGAMCGSGILALPKALVDSGWSGLPLLIICGLISSFTGNILGKCWTIVRQRYPEYNNQFIPDPYPTIGFRAAGVWGRRLTRFCMIATLFGGAVVFLLLIAGNLANLVESLSHHQKSFHTCYWLLIVVAFLTPLSWLGTPKDFWQAGVIGASTTAVAAVLIVISLGATPPPSLPNPITHANPSFVSFFNAFGTILFAFGGASCFPNIQVDMKNPDKFPVSVVAGIGAVLFLYIPVSMSGFIVIGDEMNSSNILDEIANNWMLYAVIFLITSHLLMAVLIVANPVNQDLEGLFGLPDKFTWKRCLLRTCMMLLMLIVGLTIPHFGVILSLVGGTTVTACNFVFPPLFYLLLSRQQSVTDGYGDPPQHCNEDVITAVADAFGSDNSKSNETSGSEVSQPTTSQVSLAPTWTIVTIPFYMKLILAEIMFIGLVGGAASTYSVIASLVSGSSGFTVPCYVNWATADPQN